jgi:RimJ/RimL family protein N-acetyltransferase
LAASIDIVPMGEEHIDSFHAALDVVSRERMHLSFLEAPPIDQTRNFVLKTIAKGLPQLVALDGGRVIGWCDINPLDRPTMRHGGVLGMGLLPEWRGRGLGTRLIGQTLEAARASGFSRVSLTVRHDNARAIRLYHKTGFEIEGHLRRAMLVDGTFHDLILMALLFDAKPEVPAPGGSG